MLNLQTPTMSWWPNATFEIEAGEFWTHISTVGPVGSNGITLSVHETHFLVVNYGQPLGDERPVFDRVVSESLPYVPTDGRAYLDIDSTVVEQLQANLDGFSNDFAAICTAAEFDAVMYDMLSYPERISIRYLRVVPA